ncbi:gamma-glutamyl-gamma-aminobutyrate hydrolase family protein [Leptothrix discophora]|uniref:Gamma-glutamyl-gamma-aminobutyrate hydrolase family protein n=1 Tax=Leptothrix discophora TaxID=89 RepID=A0ABT9G2R5_LEPDI|nr:gamma-glutamyl-gamma-aminobutyrate hydrolase family protein [Leptothrix discophora]MDP4300701.1 gamma-glutamyl-gamma-aminobutyrate hydrolase family protein [Leptothrix discophora]
MSPIPAPRAQPASRQPIVLVPACNRMIGAHPFHVAGQKYVDAVRLAGALPLVVPSATPDQLDALLDLADGVLLTGSPSNVHPSHFGEAVHDTRLPLDPLRDDWTLPLIPKVLARGMPLFAICRGFQEVNVALGGSLHQAVQEVPGQHDHRAPPDAPVDVQYGPSHRVRVTAGGLLERLLADVAVGGDITVNSVHGQGVKRLADGLRVEARAPDGLVEAFTRDAGAGTGFLLGVQWHPEWQAADNPVSIPLLQAFGAACQDYRDLHRPPNR